MNRPCSHLSGIGRYTGRGLMNYARREERIPRGILSGSLLSAVIAAAYRDLVVHTPALVPSPTYKFYDIPPWSRDVRLTREKITIIFFSDF